MIMMIIIYLEEDLSRLKRLHVHMSTVHLNMMMIMVMMMMIRMVISALMMLKMMRMTVITHLDTIPAKS